MKTIAANLVAHYAGRSITAATAIRITRTDGQVFGYTSHDENVTIDAVTYDAGQGFDASEIVSSAGYAVDNLEIRTLDDGTLFTRADVLGGRWQNAQFLIFRYDWATPANGVEYLMAGVFGELHLQAGVVVVELRSLKQYLQQPVGNVATRTCRARFADYPTPNGKNLCGLSSTDYIESGVVSAVTSRAAFSMVAAFADVDDYYGEGILTWTTGANAGLSQKIRTHTFGSNSSDGDADLVLSLPMPADIAVADTFQVIAGCRKRWHEDCHLRFGNAVNFQGEPHLAGIDALTALPDVQA
jgi:uncharacterized phage protein (TIGR02218 family)